MIFIIKTDFLSAGWFKMKKNIILNFIRDELTTRDEAQKRGFPTLGYHSRSEIQFLCFSDRNSLCVDVYQDKNSFCFEMLRQSTKRQN